MTEQHDERPGQLTKRDPNEVEPAVLDAEIVDEDEPGPDRPRRRATLTVIGERVPSRAAVQARARAAPRDVARAGYVTGRGMVSWAARLASALTHGHIREQIRLAQAAGDKVALAEWTDRLEGAKDARLERLAGMPKTALAVGATTAMLLVLGALVLLVIGVMWWLIPDGVSCDGTDLACVDTDIGWGDWWAGVGATIATGWLVLVWLAGAAAVVAVPLTAVLAWREGQRVAEPPRWLLAPEVRAQANAEITEDSITQAMRHMGIAALTRALKAGEQLVFVVAPREQGGGTYFQVRLPLGVKAADFLKSEKVELLGGNLQRHKHETWPQRQPLADARVLDCWIADKGTMDRPAPEWPLLHDGTFNVFRDRAPWGVTMRRDPILIAMLQKHWLLGASSKQGKTTALRLLLLTLALDVDVEFRISDLKGDGDFKMFEPMCHTYIEGQAKEDAEASVVMLEDLVKEMQRRYSEKTRLGIVGPITEQLARKRGSGFHPIFAVVDECQVMYMAGKSLDGKTLLGGSKDESRAQEAAKRLHDQARAMNIQLLQSTQRPDPQTVPVRVREGVHVRASLYVPNINAAKMILADAADRGARPYDLRPGADAGTVVVAGEVEDIPSGQAFVIVRTHYVSTKQAWTVAKRAIELRKRRGLHLVAAPPTGEPEVNHLASIRATFGNDTVLRTTEVLSRLPAVDVLYEGWGHQDLAEALYGPGGKGDPEVPIRKSHGQSVVRLEDVETALEGRSRRA